MIPYFHLLQLAMPEVIVVITALIVLMLDLLFLRNHPTRLRFTVAAGLASAGCAGAILRLLFAPEQANILDGMLLANSLTQFVQVALLILTIVTLLLSVD